jgi:hypothetical protein
MRPIPTAYLPDNCILKTVFINGEATETVLSHVRIELEKTAGSHRESSGTLWFDCHNSEPSGTVFALTGEKLGGKTVRRQFIVSGEEEIDITGIKYRPAITSPHHFEVKLGGVIPYNG